MNENKSSKLDNYKYGLPYSRDHIDDCSDSGGVWGTIKNGIILGIGMIILGLTLFIDKDFGGKNG